MGKKIIVNENKYYIEDGDIRLVYEFGEYVGWYRPALDEVV